MPSGGSDSGWSSGYQEIFQPQAEALEGVYGDASSVYQGYKDTMSDGSIQNNLENWNQGVQDTAQGGWQNQMQGGNLAGRDIAGNLSNRLGTNNNVVAPFMQAGSGVASMMEGQNVRADLGRASTANATMGQANLANATMGQANLANATIGQANLANATMGQGAQLGNVQNSQAANAYNNNIGPGGSLANMEGMYRRQAKDATSDMLGSMDARAAASGMSGGSGHGTAIGRGMEGINQNLQNQMASTGYDAYNRDIDRKLNIGAQADQFNQQRALSDQNSTNQFGQSNQNAANQFSLSNQNALQQMQGRNLDAINRFSQGNQNAQQQMQFKNLDATNQFSLSNQNAQQQMQGRNLDATNQFSQGNQNALNQFGLANQAANNQFALANQSMHMQTAGRNQDAQNQFAQSNIAGGNAAAQANMQANMQAQLANQGYSGNQQQLIAQLLAQQNASQQSALSQTGAMAGLGNLGYSAAMAPAQSWSQMLQSMGPPTVLNNSLAQNNGSNWGA